MNRIYEKWVQWASAGSDARFWILLTVQCLVILAIAGTLWILFIKSIH